MALKRGIRDCLRSIRPEAVALVDAFDFSDRQLNSALGRRDGHVYPHLLKWAESSPLNREQVNGFFD
jgi:acyl-CoA oxidase